MILEGTGVVESLLVGTGSSLESSGLLSIPRMKCVYMLGTVAYVDTHQHTMRVCCS